MYPDINSPKHLSFKDWVTKHYRQPRSKSLPETLRLHVKIIVEDSAYIMHFEGLGAENLGKQTLGIRLKL